MWSTVGDTHPGTTLPATARTRGVVLGASAVALTVALLSGCSAVLPAAGDPGAPPAASEEEVPSSSPAVPEPAPTTPDPTTPAPVTPPTPSPVPTQPPAPPATEPVEPPPAAQPAPAPEPEPAALGRGDEGEEVLALQRRLADLGYYLPAPDGRFGAATQQAVWALQKAAGLGRDGLVGPRTLAALDDGVRPTPRTSTGRAIEVDLQRQLLLAVDDGVVTRVINASTGNGETYEALGRPQRAITPTGDYRVIREIDGMHESTLELGSMYRPKYFRGGWAVHGSPSIPPWPASHGCVRVSDAAMDWIWDTWGAPVGTTLVVY